MWLKSCPVPGLAHTSTTSSLRGSVAIDGMKGPIESNMTFSTMNRKSISTMPIAGAMSTKDGAGLTGEGSSMPSPDHTDKNCRIQMCHHGDIVWGSRNCPYIPFRSLLRTSALYGLEALAPTPPPPRSSPPLRGSGGGGRPCQRPSGRGGLGRRRG